MAQPRSVRFMPMAGHAANAPPPVFSPTQAETQPSLLHSVFSLQQHPTAQRAPQTEAERAADAAFRAQLSKSIDYSLGGEEYLPEAHNTQANNTVEETADRQMPFRGMAIDTTHHRAYPGMAVISTTRSPSPRRPGGIRQVGGFAIENISPLSTTTNRDRDVFFSPQASLADLTSPTSVNTFKTTTSFKTLPDVTMLDVDNINECESVKSLEHIIEFLDAEGTFQALLRKARSRLEFVLSKTEAPNRYLVEKPFLAAPKTQPFFPPDKKGPPPPPPPPKRAVTEIRANYDAANPSGQQTPPPPPVFQQRQPAGQPKSAPPPPPPPPPPILPPPTLGAPQPVKKMASPPKFTTFVPRAAPRNPTTANTSSENQHYAIQLDSVQEDHSPPKSQELAVQPTRSTVAPEPVANLNDTNESSLVMSLSSSMMDANFNFDEQIESAPVLSSKSLASRTTSLESSSNRRLAGRQSPSQAYHHDKSLSEELKRLTETVLNMETARAADRKLFLDKLMSLDEQQNRNGNGGRNLKSIEGMMEKSVASTCELLSSMEQLRRESHELQENVKKERYSWNRTYEEAQHLESRLYQKAEELTLQLTNIPLAANEANVAKAQEMRAQYEAEMARKDRENKELANNLRDTLEGLLVSLGRNKNEVSRMTRVEQKTLVSSFAKQQLSSKAAMEAIAQEAARLERDRSEASRAAQTIKVQLEKSKKAQLQLEHENFELCEKIQELTEELSDMRIKMQELSTNRNSEQDKKYQDIIRTLKDQLRKEETSKFGWFCYAALFTTLWFCFAYPVLALFRKPSG